MKSPNSQKIKVVFGLLLAATLIVSFQNCSSPFSFEKVQLKTLASNGNGTGYDGKPFVNHGFCETAGSLDVKATIIVQTDQSGLLVRENCRDLEAPKSIDRSEMRKMASDASVFVYEDEIFDDAAPDVASKRKLTRIACFSMPNSYVQTETRIWYYGDALLLNSTQPQLVGQQTTSSGYNSGRLSPVRETYGSNGQITYSYVQDNSGPSSTLRSFDLSIYYGGAGYPSYGSSNCQDNAGQISSTGGMQCYTQALVVPAKVN